MPTSDEDLQQKSNEVQKLREQVADAEAKRVSREAELANDVTMTQLEAEEAALKARLAVAKDAGKVTAVKQGASAPLSAAKEQMERAVAQQKAAENQGDNSARATESTTSAPAGGDASSKSAGATTTEKGGK